MQGQHKLELCRRAAKTKEASMWSLSIKSKFNFCLRKARKADKQSRLRA